MITLMNSYVNGKINRDVINKGSVCNRAMISKMTAKAINDHEEHGNDNGENIYE